MFLGHRVSIENHLPANDKSEHTLLLHFRSAFLIGRQIETEHKKLVLYNGDSSRLYVRKAQYHVASFSLFASFGSSIEEQKWGWDWGVSIMTCGPYRPVLIEQYNTKFQDVKILAQVNPELQASVTVELALQGAKEDSLAIRIELLAASGKVVCGFAGLYEKSKTMRLHIKEPELWWPIGMGKQVLYTVRLTLSNQSVSEPFDFWR